MIIRLRILLLCFLPLITAHANDLSSESQLIGLWEGKKIAGPEIQGEIILSRSKGSWSADVSGYKLQVKNENGQLSFSVPGARGSFIAQLSSDDNRIEGHWIQPETINNGMKYASPILLTPVSDHQWQGTINAMNDEFSLYLPVWKNDDGELSTFLRNPERGLGAFLNVEQWAVKGKTIQWLGRSFRSNEKVSLLETQIQNGDILADIRGQNYRLQRRSDNNRSHFYARGKYPNQYRYTPPLQIKSDGWKTSTLKAQNIDDKYISQFIDDVVLKSARSIEAPYIHGILIARGGKLVLEEYFHGFHRNKPHDTRSASKSVTSLLAGAAIHSGAPISLDSSIYKTLRSHSTQREESSKFDHNDITLEHLLTMSSGLACDDGDSSSPGNEDVMQSQSRQPNWIQYTLDLPMIRAPGSRAVYCTGGINLIGAALSSATGRNLETLFHQLIAKPLQVHRYYLNLSPTGEPYMGGGTYWLPRDFMKIGQVILNEGMWNNTRIVSSRFAKKSIAASNQMHNQGYGYAWWSTKYPYKGRTIDAFFAAGNGGQIVMGIPELDLLIAFFAGNYSTATGHKIHREFIPKYFLPAIH